MKFRTEITPTRWRESIGYDDTILSLGSCFANNIAAKLAERKFRVVASPTGILFNPASIASAIERMAELKAPCQEELIEVGGRWLSYDFHSDISATTKAEAIATMQKAIEIGNKVLTTVNYTIITLGTAWVYRLKSSGEVVANCHKQPHQNFSRELLSVADVVEMLERIIKATQSHIIFTVSPVRHIGEGAEDNSLSKSILRVAIAEVCRRYSERTVYFPSYEIMLDDLRDYRFYADDLVHPTQMAVDYIADKFFEVALSNQVKEFMPKVLQIARAASHRPSNPASEEHKLFCRKQLDAIASMPEINFEEEKRYFEQMLQINL